MAEFIKREAVIDLITRRYENPEICTQEINSIPAADVAPVVHGHWVEKELFIPWCDDDVDIIYECSCCRTESGGTSPYCPNCGAKLDGGADNG